MLRSSTLLRQLRRGPSSLGQLAQQRSFYLQRQEPGRAQTQTKTQGQISLGCHRRCSTSPATSAGSGDVVGQLGQESFLGGSAAMYVETMYKSWLEDPESVHQAWREYFSRVDAGMKPGDAFARRHTELRIGTAGLPATEATLPDILAAHQSVQQLIRAYQIRGLHAARLDPLGIMSTSWDRARRAELEAFTDRFTGPTLNSVFRLPATTRLGGDQANLPLNEIIARLKKIYCNSIGLEYMFLLDGEQCDWIRERFEPPGCMALTTQEKRTLMARLIRSTLFEDFLQRKWSSEKRFGLEGCEVLIPALKQIIDSSSKRGVESFVLGMPHRGRLNVLANVARKPLDQIFAQFDSALESNEEGSGDVKYHLGTTQVRLNHATEKTIKISLCANPSHLEAVDPVVQGKAFAEQFYNGDKDGEKTMSVLIHGDAAFSGQGVVYETFNLSALPHYGTHGTIHVIVNNQIGFTTDPRAMRSSPYCTDVARVVQAPIFHVNADDPEAVMHVCKFAAEWRHHWKKDVVIDLVCYRRNGHNEVDNPMFTQPLMYQTIQKHRPVADLYREKVVKEGSVSRDEFDAEAMRYRQICDAALHAAQDKDHQADKWLDSPWKGFFNPDSRPLGAVPSTGVASERLRHIGREFSTPPPDFALHDGTARVLRQRVAMLAAGRVDWALGEAMAVGSVLMEGKHVRLSGQDVERGTFSHRHHVLHHQNVDGMEYRPLDQLADGQGRYTVCNSSLSEFAVLGFELGFSMVSPHSLVMWEAQFGDFHNTAQCIIDQFLSSGQTKWVQQSGLVLLLPHGHEGMGPEHSSARPERFLQMSCDDADCVPTPTDGRTLDMQQLFETNWIIANCSTPASFFHVLRRQLMLDFRKPLVVLTPKSLLRHPDARSDLDEFGEGTHFKRLLHDPLHPDGGGGGSVEAALFCSGKVYYDLVKERERRQVVDRVAIVRVEQLSPFPFDLVREAVSRFPGAGLAWVQEEPKNQGYWQYVQPRFATATDGAARPRYVGRPASASPATGCKQTHVKELQCFLDSAFLLA